MKQRLVIGLLLISLMGSLNACGSSAPLPAPPTCNLFSPRTGPVQDNSDRRDSDVSWKEIKDDIDKAVYWTNDYWAHHFEECFGIGYRPPQVPDYGAGVRGLFDVSHPASCGKETDLKDNNAWYCPSTDSVAWGRTYMETAEKAGDGWAYLVVAHEWGHAIQAQVPERYVSQKLELQADCLASAAINGADRETKFIWQEGDPREAAIAFVIKGDDKAWDQAGDHGDPLERTWAFQEGRQFGADGLNACFRIAWTPDRT